MHALSTHRNLAFLLALSLAPALQAAGMHEFLSSYQGAATCVSCHETAADEILKTTHWTWEHTDPKTGEALGKNHVVNNFCVALSSNEPRCTSCHVGIGYRDKTFDFGDWTKVDCLVCHDTTGTYRKTPTGAGAPDPTVDLLAVARSAGPTSRATCGACHFYGGGGDAVKHGDLDSTMKNPLRALDVHMGTDGGNMSCSACHIQPSTGEGMGHQFRGSHYTQPETEPAVSCENCHSASPHASVIQNTHAQRVACQTCHIPAFARGGHATKMSWDWSTAGQKGPDGKPLVIKDAQGNPLYDGMKGTFVWESNVVPDYIWFNGDVNYLTIAESFDPANLVTLTVPGGAINDPKAKIFPVKRFTGRQPYDAVSKTLVIPHLFALNTNDTAAYWKGYNWTNAIVAGMANAGLPFSGQVGWVNTEMFWVQNHMVAPAEQALQCAQCHVPNGRINFAELGYAPEQAVRLQSMMGFEIAQIEMQPATSSLTLRWIGTPGHRYQIQASSDLRGWSDLPDGQIISGPSAGELTWSAPTAVTRFFRIVRFAQ